MFSGKNEPRDVRVEVEIRRNDENGETFYQVIRKIEKRERRRLWGPNTFFIIFAV